MIYTFYSYKGGVGRSMALVNIAELMYREGRKVLMIDWDLEAPGLERFFPYRSKQVTESLGVIDMLIDYKEKATAFDPKKEDALFPVYNLDDYIVDIYPGQTDSGSLHLLPAGKRDGVGFANYVKRVMTFDWVDFYQNWEGEIYFEWLREQLESLVDVVLIDSRTGITEMGGVCTDQLADVVVLLCAANDQNMDGTLRMLNRFYAPQLKELRSERELKAIPIPSRIERLSETESLNDFRQKFRERFFDYLPNELKDDKDFFLHVEIPYVPLYAFEEKIAISRQSAKDRSIEMEEAYNKLHQILVKLDPSYELLADEVKFRTHLLETRLESLREQLINSYLTMNRLEKEVALGDDDSHIFHQLAQIKKELKDEKKSKEMETLIKDFRTLSALLEKATSAAVNPSGSVDHLEIEFPYGAVKPESKSYIERDADRLCWRHVNRRWGSTIFIKAPRQLGKSSLIRRILHRAEKDSDKKSAFIDFQRIPQDILEDRHSFLIEFCSMIGAELGIPDAIEQFWSPRRQQSRIRESPIRKCSEYLSKYLIPQLNGSFILALDEVDRILTTSFRSDFFRMLRAWHNDRAEDESFAKMTLFLSCSTDPALFIENPEESPFNVAEVIELEDFSKEQVEELNQRYGTVLNQQEIEDLIEMVEGHPFLVRVAFYEILTQGETLPGLLRKGLDGEGAYGHHLSQLLFRVSIEPELKEALVEICQHQRTEKNRTFYRLKSAGLIKERGQRVMFRNKLYEQYFCKQQRSPS